MAANPTRVPLVDLDALHRPIRTELDAALAGVLDSGRFVLGPCVERFERAFADYLGVAECVALNSGTSALHLALLTSGIGPGDEVITTPLTWVSTAWAISYLGARPVFVDVDPVTYNLDPKQAAAAITPRTRALLPVHLYGQAADVNSLVALARDHELALIEDAAQAHGARVDGRCVGGFGAAGCFSFHPAKNLGALGEGGAVVLDDAVRAARIRALRDHAQYQRHEHTELGFNARMEGLQGAALEVKLRHLDRWNQARHRNATRLRSELAGLPGLALPACPDADAHVWHLFVLLVEGDRDAFRAALADRGVDTGRHYPLPLCFPSAEFGHLGPMI